MAKGRRRVDHDLRKSDRGRGQYVHFLTLDTGFQLVDVSTQVLNEKASDNKGKIRVKAGDKITVHGSVTDGLLDSNKLIATRVIEK